MPRAFERIINKIDVLRGKNNIKLWVSFLEVYNEKIYDLLNPTNLNNLEIREGKKGTI